MGDCTEILLEHDRDEILLPIDRKLVGLARGDQDERAEQSGHEQDDKERPDDDLRDEALASIVDRRVASDPHSINQHRNTPERSNITKVETPRAGLLTAIVTFCHRHYRKWQLI